LSGDFAAHFRGCFRGWVKRAHTDAVPDDDDRPRDASGAADHGWSDPASNDPALAEGDWSNAVAPDDISALASDIAAYHREQRAARRNAWLQRVFARRGVTQLSLIAAALALAVGLATLITALEPDRSSNGPSALPLAHPTTQVGQPHGLLPDVSLQDSYGNFVDSRSLRPSVLALIPLHCQCVPLLNRLADEATTRTLPLMVIAPTVNDAEANSMSGQLRKGAQIYYDSSDALAADLGARGVTLVVLDRDGTIFDVQKAVPAQGSNTLDGLLQTMHATPRASA
jgi:hypothetical protein